MTTKPMPNEDLDELLKLDPLQEAEKITGNDYKLDSTTSSLGFLIMQEKSAILKKALEENGDTTFSMTMESYCTWLEAYGFKKIHENTFYREKWDVEDVRQIWYHEDGLLLSCDSFNGNRNSAKVYYNWKPNEIYNGKYISGVTSSGQYHEDANGEFVWSGDHDAREALGRAIERLKEYGSFVKPWEHRPWLRLGFFDTNTTSGYTVEGGKEKDKYDEDMIASFPEEVRELIGPKVEV
jgi:hypothetical protein